MINESRWTVNLEPLTTVDPSKFRNKIQYSPKEKKNQWH